ncbi:MAG: alpha-L-fucosidase [Lentimonas sp.]
MSTSLTHVGNGDESVSVTVSSASNEALDQETPYFLPEWPSIAKHRTPEWFRDAKFGIYSCLGPPTIGTQYQTTEWYAWAMYKTEPTWWTNGPRTDIKDGSYGVFDLHKEKFGDQNEFGYKDFIKLFQPTEFNAKEWVDVFEASGAKFVGPMAVHHDNYMLWDSALTKWDVKDTVGFDMVGELEKEIRERNMKFVLTFHHAFSWWFFYPSYSYDGGQPGNEDLYWRPHPFSSRNDSFAEYPDEAYEQHWYELLEEACTTYSPDLIWFDMGLELLSEKIRQKAYARILNHAHDQQQQIGISYKIKYSVAIPPKSGILDYEKGRSTVTREEPWLTDTPLGGWFYNGRKSRSPEAVIEILTDITSKNGCMMLCVSPKPDGTLPEDQVTTLKAVGKWLEMNGEAIYNTRPWVIAGEGPTELAKDDHFNENWEAIYTEKDLRYTRSKDGNVIYITVLDRPSTGKVTATQLADIYPYLERNVERVQLLGTDQAIEWSRDSKGLHLEFPDNAQGAHAWCYKLTLGSRAEEGSAIFDWSEVPTGSNWWETYNYREADNGAILITSGRAAADSIAGNAVKASYQADVTPGTFKVQVGGVNRSFKLNSVDLSAVNSNGEFNPKLVGMLNGKVQWTIDPDTDGQMRNYSKATEGDSSLPIDSILWETGVSSNPDGHQGNRLDNLHVTIVE